MEGKGKFFNVEVLGYICGVLQILGFIFIVISGSKVIIGIAGFAGIVQVFLPFSGTPIQKRISNLAALCSVGIVIIALI